MGSFLKRAVGFIARGTLKQKFTVVFNPTDELQVFKLHVTRCLLIHVSPHISIGYSIIKRGGETERFAYPSISVNLPPTLPNHINLMSALNKAHDPSTSIFQFISLFQLHKDRGGDSDRIEMIVDQVPVISVCLEVPYQSINIRQFIVTSSLSVILIHLK